jgi:hypothetical protein
VYSSCVKVLVPKVRHIILNIVVPILTLCVVKVAVISVPNYNR